MNSPGLGTDISRGLRKRVLANCRRQSYSTLPPHTGNMTTGATAVILGGTGELGMVYSYIV